MNVVVVDSGMGGLAVAARLYERLVGQELAVAVRFVNVRPPPGRRFEEHGTDAQKIGRLDQALQAVERALDMDLMALACNSLCALIHRTEFHSRSGGRLVLLDALSDEHRVPAGDVEVFVFGTELTIRGGAHRRALVSRGVRERQIIEQACPGLANSIQDDHRSDQTAALLHRYVGEALARSRRSSAVEAVALLACSHYGYLEHSFREAFAARGIRSVRLLCANDSMVSTVVRRIEQGGVQAARSRPSISVHALHPLTAIERDNFIDLIGPISAVTASRLAHVAPLGLAGC